jgi:iron complex transport system ATP-binding protein
MTTPLMTFQEVVFGYNRRGRPVIDGLDLALLQGSITAILGPNGAGKTTLLYLTLGWLRPWSGKITLAGQPLAGFSRRALGQEIALIPQNETHRFEHTVLEYVLLGRAPYLPPLGMPTRTDETIALQALERVGIPYLYNQSILEISGGERQLVLAARALAQEPQLLLSDEPTSHLDLSNKFRLVNILKGLREQGATILMTTHEPDIALAVSDYAILMAKGRVLAAGPTQQVITGETLSQVYQVPVRIVPVEGKSQVLWM